jgi:spermidine synthase
MLPWVQLGTAAIPGGGELRLQQRGTEFWIMTGNTALMTSRMSGSEEALATLSAERLAGRTSPRVLIGGLGMGFTLRAALAVLPPGARITVSELVPGVVEWARGPLAPLFAGSLDDPRVQIETVDVARLIAAARATYDAILLDVDNGPEGLSRDSNEQLYSHAGLGRSKTALKPGGHLAVWSSHPDPKFTRRLTDAGFRTEELKVRERAGGKGGRHIIWMATRA